MHSKGWTVLFCAIALGLSVFALRGSHQTTALRDEAARLLAEIQSLDTVKAKHERLLEQRARAAREAKLEEIEATRALQENETEAHRLQTEIERLKAAIAASPKAPKLDHPTPNAGTQALLNQLLQAAQLGNTHRIAELIAFAPGDQLQAEALFAQLPPETQAEYGSAQHLMASIAALTVLPPNVRSLIPKGKPQISEDKNSVTWRLEGREQNSKAEPFYIDYLFRRNPGADWFLVVSPEMMGSYRQAVASAVKKIN